MLGEYQKCPICDGTGQVSGGYFTRAGDAEQSSAATTMDVCRICGGKGIIARPMIEDDKQ